MKLNINKENSHSSKDLNFLNYLHGRAYADQIMQGKLEYNIDSISAGSSSFIVLNTHLHSETFLHGENKNVIMLSNISSNFKVKPEMTVAFSDYLNAAYLIFSSTIIKETRKKPTSGVVNSLGFNLIGFYDGVKYVNSEKALGLKQLDSFKTVRINIQKYLHSSFKDLKNFLSPSSDDRNGNIEKRILSESSPWKILGLPINISRERLLEE